MYKIIDLQGDTGYDFLKKKFKTKKDVINTLIDFHYDDYEPNSQYNNFKEYIMSYKGLDRQLDVLLSYGQWEIKKIK